MNDSKKKDPRYWALWAKSGAIEAVNVQTHQPKKVQPRGLSGAISMVEAKVKLSNLQEFMPEQSTDLIYELGAYLATRLNDRLVPAGFVLGMHLALYDLKKGINGFTGEPIRNSLVGYPPMLYDVMSMYIPRIARAVFPEDFANEVQLFVDEANKQK